MQKSGKFSSERLFFHGITEADTDLIVRWRSSEDNVRFFRIPKLINREEHLQWFREKYTSDNNRFDYIVHEKKSGTPVGTVGIKLLEDEPGACEVSYMIAEPEYQHKGYATESIQAIMKEVANDGIRVFYAEIHVNNEASIRTVKRIGYKKYSQTDDFALYRRTL